MSLTLKTEREGEERGRERERERDTRKKNERDSKMGKGLAIQTKHNENIFKKGFPKKFSHFGVVHIFQ